MHTVWVLKSAPKGLDAYRALLEPHGAMPVHVPVLGFEPLAAPVLAALAARDIAGVIATSARAAEALSPTHWVWQAETLPVFVVGPATASALPAGVGAERVCGRECGSASALAALLVQKHTETPFERPLLFLCSEQRLDTLPAALAAAGIELIEAAVYRTKAQIDLGALPAERPAAAVFYSPSGVDAVASVPGDWDCVSLVAVGPTTGAAVRAWSGRVDAVAEKPTAEGVCEAVAQALLAIDAGKSRAPPSQSPAP